MTQPIPSWLMQRYSILWKEYKKNEFNYSDAISTLQEKKDPLISVVLSSLKRRGWLTIKLDSKDSRKRIYKLKTPEEAVEEIADSKK